jgi:ribosomal protein L25 (general stress protein Ctc)
MPSNFLDYEKEHNRFIKALRENKEYANIVSIIREKQASIMVPHDQSVTLPNDQINHDFVQTHIIYYNPQNQLQWTSLNGVRGSFSENYDTITIESGPPRGEDQISFFRDPLALFRQEKPTTISKKIHVLRVSDIDINSNNIRMILISEPVSYEGCTWSGPSFVANNTSSLRNMFNSPVTPTEESSSPLRRTDSSLSVTGSGDSDAVDYGGPPIVFAAVNSNSAVKTNRPANALINELISKHNISNNGLFISEQQEKNVTDNRNKKKFSFQDFVDKMRHKSAINLVRRIKKFIYDVNKNDYSENLPDIVLKFLNEVMQEIKEHPQWKNASEQEIDNAREGIEKYVMTKIYSKVFSPTIDDLKQDNVLATRLSSFRKLRPEHLDIPANIFLDPSCNVAVEELKKMNNYKTPRDKMICISNCCKIIFNVLTKLNPKEAPSADSFLPVLIFLVMKANPPHLHSNLKYIMEYRNPDKMISESGYFLTNLQSTIMFWANVEHTSLSIDKHEFDKLINGQYFTESDEEVETMLSASPKFNSDLNDRSSITYESSDDDEDKRSNIDSDQSITPLVTERNEPGDGIEMETKSSGTISPKSSASFPMTPLSRSERRKSVENVPIVNSNDGHTTESASPLEKLIQTIASDQFTQGFIEAKSVNELHVGDLERLLLEYKKLYQFFSDVKQLVSQVPPLESKK